MSITKEQDLIDNYVEGYISRGEFERGVEGMSEKLLLISGYDEWYGPIYTCPFCTEENFLDEFNYCPNCGADLKGLKFESIAAEEGRTKKDNER